MALFFLYNDIYKDAKNNEVIRVFNADRVVGDWQGYQLNETFFDKHYNAPQ
jgi:hypothetical protein